MKTKTINSVINKKFDEWLASIQDEEVRKVVNKNTVLTGGSIASMLLREKVNDFDFYFRNIETAAAVADYYLAQFRKNPPPSFKGGKEVQMWVEVEAEQETNLPGEPLLGVLKQVTPGRVRIHIKSAGIAGEESSKTSYEYFESAPPEDAGEYVERTLEVKKDMEEKPDYRPVFLTSNAISLSGDVQLILRFYGEPAQIHENYDYVHATNYWTSWDRKVTLRPEALECLLTKELRYIGSKYPICSLIRARKFIQREWTINAGQFLKIAFQVNELDMNDYKVLEEQLVGMDVAYFGQVLAALREKDPEKINKAYLTEIIDRIFS
jgi:hypothetical protein